MIDLALSEEQERIVGGALEMLAGDAGEDVHASLAGWGWFGVGLDERRGGLGLGPAEEALLHFEAGRSLLPLSALATSLAVDLAAEDACAALLDGTRRAALAMPAGDGFHFAFDRQGASDLIVIDGSSIRLLAADAFEGEALDGFDETVRMERGRLAGTRQAAEAPSDRALILVAAMLAGMARACSDLAAGYAKVREQFGQPIGAFQAVKHLCADMGLRAYGAEAQARLAAVVGAADRFQLHAAVATTIDAAVRNAEAAIQVHGGMGFTAECRVHFDLKRAHLLSRLIGGRSEHLHVLLALDPAGPEKLAGSPGSGDAA